jgi:hypothetical protein
LHSDLYSIGRRLTHRHTATKVTTFTDANGVGMINSTYVDDYSYFADYVIVESNGTLFIEEGPVSVTVGHWRISPSLNFVSMQTPIEQRHHEPNRGPKKNTASISGDYSYDSDFTERRFAATSDRPTYSAGDTVSIKA